VHTFESKEVRMAFGIAESPENNPTDHLDGVDYPVWREQLVKSAADGGASVDIINLFKSLPRTKYESKEEIQRDLAEAARRFGAGLMGGEEPEDRAKRDRRNIGRDAVEGAQEPLTRHP
jgi:hypothetical protein